MKVLIEFDVPDNSDADPDGIKGQELTEFVCRSIGDGLAGDDFGPWLTRYIYDQQNNRIGTLTVNHDHRS